MVKCLHQFIQYIKNEDKVSEALAGYENKCQGQSSMKVKNTGVCSETNSTSVRGPPARVACESQIVTLSGGLSSTGSAASCSSWTWPCYLTQQ